MYGSNPFRRNSSAEPAPNSVQHNVPIRTLARILPIDTDLPREKKQKPAKTVRIVSPHSAVSDDEHAVPADLFTSLQSPSQLQNPTSTDNALSKNLENEFIAGSFEAQSPYGNLGPGQARAYSDTPNNAVSPQPNRRLKHVMPANPFKKNAKISEPKSHGFGGTSASGDSSTSKTHYNVDDFKRLLMADDTGVIGASVSLAPPVSFQGQQSTGDTRIDTDSSTVSRQSVFEPDRGAHHDSPRTSIEVSSSDDERQRLVGAPPPREVRSKPSAPKPRHGKLVKANAPQTVSFEDQALSILKAEENIAPLTEPSAQVTPAAASNVDKQKPALPLSSGASPDSENINTIEFESNHDPMASEGSPKIPKKDPPPLPVSRRPGQARPKSLLGISGRPDSISEDTLAGSTSLPQCPSTHPSKAPPPPRPRRSGPRESSTSTPTISSFSPGPDLSSGDVWTPRPRPPVPPARSISSSSSASKRAILIQPGSSSPSTAPPPPPRRRGSSQSSYTSIRLSGDYRNVLTERLRSNSGSSSLSQDPTTSMVVDRERNDVMTDLSRLQKEVDDRMKEISVQHTL